MTVAKVKVEAVEADERAKRRKVREIDRRIVREGEQISARHRKLATIEEALAERRARLKSLKKSEPNREEWVEQIETRIDALADERAALLAGIAQNQATIVRMEQARRQA